MRHDKEAKAHLWLQILEKDLAPTTANTDDDDDDEKNNRNTITDRSSTALYAAHTVDTVYTVDMVYIVVGQSEYD